MHIYPEDRFLSRHDSHRTYQQLMRWRFVPFVY